MTESKLRVSLMPTPPEGVELPDKPRATFRWVSTAIVIALVWWSACAEASQTAGSSAESIA